MPEKIAKKHEAQSEQHNRADRIIENAAFRSRISRLLAKAHETQPNSEYVEQRIYDSFPSTADAERFTSFHRSGWPRRLKLIQEFEDDRYRQLGQRSVAFERPELLSDNQRSRYLTWLRERLLPQKEVPWLTIPNAVSEIRGLKSNASSSQLAQLDDLENYLRLLEAKLNSE